MDQVYVYLPFTLRQVVPIMLGIRSLNEPIKEFGNPKIGHHVEKLWIDWGINHPIQVPLSEALFPSAKICFFFWPALKKNYEFDA